MTVPAATATIETHLPQLRGRWVFAYRLLWASLAIAAVVVMGTSLYLGSAHPAVQALRLIKCVILLCVCTILLKRRANDPVAALLSLAFLTWTITSSTDFASANILPTLADRVRFLFFVTALLLFPDGSWRPGWTKTVAAASSAVFLLGIAEGTGLAPTQLFLPFAIPCVVAAVAALISRFRASESEAVRLQLKWVALGLVPGIALILGARTGAWLSNSSSRFGALPILWEGMFQLGVIVIALGFLVSLLRYRLFDAETAISRSAALAILTIALVATFAGTEASIEWVGQQYFGMGIGNVSAAMAAAVAAVLLNPLHGKITDWAEYQFQPDLALLKRQMPELLARLSVDSTTRQLGASVLPHINQAIHATYSAILLDGRIVAVCGVKIGEARRWTRDFTRSETPLGERNCGDLVFPLHLPLSDARPGAARLLLGLRPDGTLYGREDLDAVRSTFPALQHALTSAMAREAFDAAIDRRERRLWTEVSDLRSRLRAIENSLMGDGCVKCGS